MDLGWYGTVQVLMVVSDSPDNICDIINPHKLSLYLSSGLPVIIWKEAAEADFVEKQGVGICVDSLKELSAKFEMLDENAYNKYAESVRELSEKLRTGQFGKYAILSAEDILKL